MNQYIPSSPGDGVSFADVPLSNRTIHRIDTLVVLAWKAEQLQTDEEKAALYAQNKMKYMAAKYLGAKHEQLNAKWCVTPKRRKYPRHMICEEADNAALLEALTDKPQWYKDIRERLGWSEYRIRKAEKSLKGILQTDNPGGRKAYWWK
jgi:hypothetical protein